MNADGAIRLREVQTLFFETRYVHPTGLKQFNFKQKQRNVFAGTSLLCKSVCAFLVMFAVNQYMEFLLELMFVHMCLRTHVIPQEIR